MKRRNICIVSLFLILSLILGTFAVFAGPLPFAHILFPPKPTKAMVLYFWDGESRARLEILNYDNKSLPYTIVWNSSKEGLFAFTEAYKKTTGVKVHSYPGYSGWTYEKILTDRNIDSEKFNIRYSPGGSYEYWLFHHPDAPQSGNWYATWEIRHDNTWDYWTVFYKYYDMYFRDRTVPVDQGIIYSFEHFEEDSLNVAVYIGSEFSNPYRFNFWEFYEYQHRWPVVPSSAEGNITFEVSELMERDFWSP